MYQLIVYVPIDATEQVKDAIFSAGAGTLGQYSHCCFEMQGTGQFCPSAEAHPERGKRRSVNYVEESRIELLCPSHCLRNAITRLKQAHPYEHPVYAVIALTDI